MLWNKAWKKTTVIFFLVLLSGLTGKYIKPVLDQISVLNDRNVSQDRVQTYLNQVTATRANVQREGEKALAMVPGAARIRISLIRMKASGSLTFDVAYGVAAPGHELGDLVSDRPLSEWYDYLPYFLAGKCQHMHTADLTDELAKKRLLPQLVAFLACPMIDTNGRLMGGLYISWDREEDIPQNMHDAEVALFTMARAINEDML